MQTINAKNLIDIAKKHLADGSVDKVFGWKAGEFGYDVSPYIFRKADELDKDFVWNEFCGANISKYLVRETRDNNEKILVFLKPCDTYSFNQLLTEHKLCREQIYVVGVSCNGMIDIDIIKTNDTGITDIVSDGTDIIVKTLYNGEIKYLYTDVLAERCVNCKSKKHVAYDEIIGEKGEIISSGRFDEVERLERMTPDERFAFWRSELSRCIRCNACRDACPACTCEKCVFDNPESGIEHKTAANSFEENAFHIIRAFHVAGRCTDCGECSRVCPQNIPLHLLNRKFIKDINSFYGEYQAGDDVGSRAPLVDYTLNDIEPGDAVKGGGANA